MVKPCNMATQTYRLYSNVKNTAKLTTISDRNTEQTNTRTLSIEKCINK